MAGISAEQIADLAIPCEAQIAPDGRRVAYRLRPLSKKDEHMSSALWIADLDSGQAPRQFTAGEAEDSTPQWSPDGRQIAFLSDRARRSTAQLYLIDASGGEARALTSREHKKAVEQFAWSPGGGHIAFSSADEPSEEDERREKERDDANVYGERWPYARLRVISILTREMSTLVAVDAHVDCFAWSPDGSELAYVLRQTPALESWGREISLWRIPLAGGEPRLVCRFPVAIDGLQWSSDGQRLLFVSSVARKAQSSRAVYAVPAQGGEPERLALGEQNCAGFLQWPQRAEQAVVEVGEGLDTRLCWLDSSSGEIIPLSPDIFAEQLSAIYEWSVRVSEDGEVVLAVVRNNTEQWCELWAGRARQGEQVAELRQLTRHQDALNGLCQSKQEPFLWTAPDGWKLDGLLVRPADAPADRPLPMVVLVHGGPYGRWMPGAQLGWSNWAQWLAQDGYAVLMPNPRGGFGHGERFAAAARGDVGGADYADVMAAVDAAIERGIADPEKLGIGGWSQGGFMTGWAVTQSTRFKAAIMGAGVSDWGMMVMTSDVPVFERELGGSAPWEGIGPHRHAQLSPISFAQAVKTPVLILHGEKDERVPLSQATGFHRALREVGVPCELVVYPREPHGISERQHQIDLLRRVRTWYDRWLHA
jgi:dipeptidyl aminopeptidase/acylaminoacyl peptidase